MSFAMPAVDVNQVKPKTGRTPLPSHRPDPRRWSAPGRQPDESTIPTPPHSHGNGSDNSSAGASRDTHHAEAPAVEGSRFTPINGPARRCPSSVTRSGSHSSSDSTKVKSPGGKKPLTKTEMAHRKREKINNCGTEPPTPCERCQRVRKKALGGTQPCKVDSEKPRSACNHCTGNKEACSFMDRRNGWGEGKAKARKRRATGASASGEQSSPSSSSSSVLPPVAEGTSNGMVQSPDVMAPSSSPMLPVDNGVRQNWKGDSTNKPTSISFILN